MCRTVSQDKKSCSWGIIGPSGEATSIFFFFILDECDAPVKLLNSLKFKILDVNLAHGKLLLPPPVQPLVKLLRARDCHLGMVAIS